jgi:hypothetical protein
MITACALLSASALPDASLAVPSPLTGHRGLGLQLERVQRGFDQLGDFRAAGVVEVRHGDARDADGRQVLHQRLGLAREGGAHEVAGGAHLLAGRIRHRIAAHRRRAALVHAPWRRGGGARAHAAEEGEDAVLGQQLFVVGEGLLGLELVVERNHPDLAARQPALRIDRIEGQPGAGHHHLDRHAQRAAQDAGVAQDDLAVGDAALGRMGGKRKEGRVRPLPQPRRR